MSFRNVVNDGSSNAPRLRLSYSAWSLIGLPLGGAEWSREEKFDRVAQAGFEGFEGGAGSEQEAKELGNLARGRNLRFGYGAVIDPDLDVLKRTVALALASGSDYLSVQVHGALLSASQIVDKLEPMYELANGAGLPFFIETHRSRVTQDLRRTLKVIRLFPRLRFTGDFSHYVVAGELGGTWSDDVWKAFRKVARRCNHWHGRIGHGEQVQNDIGDGTGTTAQQFKKLWAYGFSEWLSKARPGDILTFVSELGPPGYSIVDLDGREISDRWQQSLVFKRLAEEAWAEASAATLLPK